MIKVVIKDTMIMMVCVSGFNVEDTLVGYEYLTKVETNCVSFDALEYWDGDCEWIGDMGSVIGVVVVFDGVGCDGDMVGNEAAKI